MYLAIVIVVLLVGGGGMLARVLTENDKNNLIKRGQ